jgi:hypothetical protein
MEGKICSDSYKFSYEASNFISVFYVENTDYNDEYTGENESERCEYKTSE